MTFLKIEAIGHIYFSKNHATTALADITHHVEEGEFVSLIGPSGCGKTTLLHIIAGLIEPTSGFVTLANKPVKQAKNQLGYMLQQDYLFPWKTIQDNVLLGLKLTKQLSTERIQYVLSLLKRMGLGNVRKQYPGELSGGMRQRVALVRTLATEPKLLLLDEPFSALDYQTKLKLENLVSETLTAFGKTAILVTHDIGEAIAMSDRIILLSAQPGKIHKIFDLPDELRNLTPFEVRNHESFANLFQLIWKEFESIETANDASPSP